MVVELYNFIFIKKRLTKSRCFACNSWSFSSFIIVLNQCLKFLYGNVIFMIYSIQNQSRLMRVFFQLEVTEPKWVNSILNHLDSEVFSYFYSIFDSGYEYLWIGCLIFCRHFIKSEFHIQDYDFQLLFLNI